MPKPVTIFDPVVRLRADMSREDISEHHIPPHFTNIQHGLQLARQFLGRAGHAQPADHPDHRRPADRPLRGPAPVPALSARPRGPKRPRCARGCSASARGSRSTSSCCPAGRSRARTCSSPTAWPNRPRGRVFFTAGTRPRPLRRLGLSEPPARDRLPDSGSSTASLDSRLARRLTADEPTRPAR